MLYRFKDAMPVSFRSILFTYYIFTIFKQQNLLPSRKYEKLPNIVIHTCKNITEKMYLLKMSGPQIWLCLFTFWPIASKKLNGLTTIDTLSWLGGAVVTHPLCVQEVPGLIPCSGKCFYFWFFVSLLLLLLCFYFLSNNTLFVTKVCNSFYNFNLFSILKILQDLWPIIRV